MAKSGTTWQSGRSGNPKGRPKKDRALTAILEQAGSKTIEVDGKRVSGKRVVARLLWELATTGQAKLPSGTVLKVNELEDMLSVWKYLYAQIDGPPKQPLELSGPDGGPIPITTIEVVKPDGT